MKPISKEAVHNKETDLTMLFFVGAIKIGAGSYLKSIPCKFGDLKISENYPLAKFVESHIN